MRMKCKYAGCESKTYPEEDYCILHMDLPHKGGRLELIKNLKEKRWKGRSKLVISTSRVPGSTMLTSAACTSPGSGPNPGRGGE